MAQYGYARCSTTRDKQDIERQCIELRAGGAETIFSEYVSGTVRNRPELQKLMATLNKGDTLTVTEVSRLSRSLHHLCHIIEDAIAKGIKLVCGSLVVDCTADKIDTMPLTMFYMMGVFAELERGTTVERIRSGIKNARQKGTTMGRPKKTAADVPQTVIDLLPDYLSGKFDKTEYASLAGISRTALYKYLRLLGVNEKPKRIRTVNDVPERIKKMYPAYKSGTFGKSEFARRAEISRSTLDIYLGLIEG